MTRDRRVNRHGITGYVSDAIPGAPRIGGGTHTFNTVKGWCTPARVFVDMVFRPLGIDATYGPVVLQYEDDPKTGVTLPVPTEQEQTITVKETQATWAEYVLGSLVDQVDFRVISGIMDKKNFARGRSRQGVPMPWLYDKLGEVPADTPQSCAKTKEQRAAVEVMVKDGRLPNVSRGNVKFTHEGSRRGQKGPEGSSTSKSTRKTAKTSGRSTTPAKKGSGGRGSHRGAHRGRDRGR